MTKRKKSRTARAKAFSDAGTIDDEVLSLIVALERELQSTKDGCFVVDKYALALSVLLRSVAHKT